ncbi:pre-miRNA 5'-monophosphate methyltransferase [Brienomyrus brachyistius]|uniref:pre-miRNA 5'-monophosphate methyltransferase n=1 Tax=Brienomyrus brachyistius TaxID=42636 RepID=UPI0020B244FD|nr:pre-miRNA 5'-monophosphate methyltransferase [Brienomyrus brachyistius]
MMASAVQRGSGDPGAAPYGNFINYYTFNPPENRLTLIPRTLLRDIGYSSETTENITVLDVGCNSGDLTVALYRHLQGQESSGRTAEGWVHLLGCDLDKGLILRAEQSNPLPDSISFIHLDVTNDQHSRTQLGSYLSKFGRSSFDLCLCLAVTMWVHLNHGDEALLELLSRLASLCHHLLLETQPWKCYRSAARRLRKLGRGDFEHFKTLKIRGDMEEHTRHHLERNCGMKLVRCFGSTAWDRTLMLFTRNAIETGKEENEQYPETTQITT